jgi:hypothetical protein
MPFDVLDLLAVIVGVLHTMRKLDVMKRRAEEYPEVAVEDFAAWQASERAAYALGSWASFLKLVLDPMLLFLAPKLALSAPVVRGLGATIDIGWAVLVLVAMLRAGRARRRRQELGIVLADPPVASG